MCEIPIIDNNFIPGLLQANTEAQGPEVGYRHQPGVSESKSWGLVSLLQPHQEHGLRHLCGVDGEYDDASQVRLS